MPKAIVRRVDSGAFRWCGTREPSPLVAAVAEEQSPFVDEFPDGDYVSAGVHDGQFGTCQVSDEVQCAGVPQVRCPPEDFGEVVGDEEGCVAVLLVGWVGGQVDDPVVGDAALALHGQGFHVGPPI